MCSSFLVCQYNSVSTLVSSQFVFIIFPIAVRWCLICVLQIEPHILYGCKASCLIAKGCHKLRLFEKREFRKMFRPKMNSGCRLDKTA